MVVEWASKALAYLTRPNQIRDAGVLRLRVVLPARHAKGGVLCYVSENELRLDSVELAPSIGR